MVFWSATKARAKRKGIEFTLTVEWFREKIDAGVCEVTGLLFEAYDPDSGYTRGPRSATVDRIDPSDGYHQNNCRMVVQQFNFAKGEWPEDSLMELVRALS